MPTSRRRSLLWMRRMFSIEAESLIDLGHHTLKDPEAFTAARAAGVVVMTKDSGFVDLIQRHGAPPQVIWLTCGNTSNRALRAILAAALPLAVVRLEAGEPVVEITGVP